VDNATRTRLVALAVLLALAVPLVVIAAAGSGSGDDSESGGLRVERAKGAPQVVIYLEDPAVNTPDTNRGRSSVSIECVDGGGAVVFTGKERWPFSDTDGGRFDPHVHVFVRPDRLDTIESCRLKGTDPPLEGPRV
jgi:hypothetical protein